MGQVCLSGKCQACTSSTQCTGGQACSSGKCQGCTSATQCPVGQVCVSGTCTSCTSSSDCSKGQVCLSGLCSACTLASQCPTPGQICLSGSCSSCTADSQCPTGLICKTGLCQSCTLSSQCLAGQVCMSGKCQSCTDNSQCATGQACVSGKCQTCTLTSQCVGDQVCASGVCRLCQGNSDCPSDKPMCIDQKCTAAIVPTPPPSDGTKSCQTAGDCSSIQMCFQASCLDLSALPSLGLSTMGIFGYGTPSTTGLSSISGANVVVALKHNLSGKFLQYASSSLSGSLTSSRSVTASGTSSLDPTTHFSLGVGAFGGFMLFAADVGMDVSVYSSLVLDPSTGVLSMCPEVNQRFECKTGSFLVGAQQNTNAFQLVQASPQVTSATPTLSLNSITNCIYVNPLSTTKPTTLSSNAPTFSLVVVSSSVPSSDLLSGVLSTDSVSVVPLQGVPSVRLGNARAKYLQMQSTSPKSVAWTGSALSDGSSFLINRTNLSLYGSVRFFDSSTVYAVCSGTSTNLSTDVLSRLSEFCLVATPRLSRQAGCILLQPGNSVYSRSSTVADILTRNASSVSTNECLVIGQSALVSYESAPLVHVFSG